MISRTTVFVVTAAASALAWVPGAFALETSLDYVLHLNGDAERHQIKYKCEGREDLLDVEYLNADPNFLAIVPIEGEGSLIFVNVLSGSGARYAASHYVWWTKGAEASLYDEMSDDANAPPILDCLEYNEIP